MQKPASETYLLNESNIQVPYSMSRGDKMFHTTHSLCVSSGPFCLTSFVCDRVPEATPDPELAPVFLQSAANEQEGAGGGVQKSPQIPTQSFKEPLKGRDHEL